MQVKDRKINQEAWRLVAYLTIDEQIGIWVIAEISSPSWNSSCRQCFISIIDLMPSIIVYWSYVDCKRAPVQAIRFISAFPADTHHTGVRIDFCRFAYNDLHGSIIIILNSYYTTSSVVGSGIQSYLGDDIFHRTFYQKPFPDYMPACSWYRKVSYCCNQFSWNCSSVFVQNNSNGYLVTRWTPRMLDNSEFTRRKISFSYLAGHNDLVLTLCTA